MSAESKQKNYSSYYLGKLILNIIAVLFYIIGSIVAFTLIPTLNGLGKIWFDMTRLSVTALILCGVALLILSLAPIVATFLLINMEKAFHQPTSKQAKWELETKTEEDVIPIVKKEKREDLVMEKPSDNQDLSGNENRKIIRTETIVQEIPNPLSTWRGRHMSSLLNIIQPESQGEMPFPSSAKTDDVKEK